MKLQRLLEEFVPEDKIETFPENGCFDYFWARSRSESDE